MSETSIGNTGALYCVRTRDGVWTNDPGMHDFFITPIGGMAWNVGEDAIDRFILKHVRHGTRNKWLLLASSLTTRGKSAANITRFRAPYYRDYDETTAGLFVRLRFVWKLISTLCARTDLDHVTTTCHDPSSTPLSLHIPIQLSGLSMHMTCHTPNSSAK